MLEQMIQSYPKQVSERDIQENSKLLTDEEIVEAKDYFNKNPDSVRFSKKQSEFKFTVVRFNDVLYAIYSGKEGKALKDINGIFADNPGVRKVKWMQNLDTAQWEVIKIITLDQISEFVLNLAKNEQKLLMLLKQGIGSFERYRESDKRKKEIKHYIIGMKAIPGVSLDHFIGDQLAQFNLVQRLDISIGVLKAIKDVHDMNIIHRDIKPSNIVLQTIGEFAATVIDYGISWLITPEIKEEKREEPIEPIGSFNYIAPEIFAFAQCFCTMPSPAILLPSLFEIYTKQSDIYAVGVTLFQLFTLNTTDNLIEKNFSVNIKKYIIEHICNFSFESRPSIEEIIDYFKSFKQTHLEVFKHIESIKLNTPHENTAVANEPKLMSWIDIQPILLRFMATHRRRIDNLTGKDLDTVLEELRDAKKLYNRWCDSLSLACPKQVDKKDIHPENGKLLTDQEIKKAGDYFAENSNAHYFSKKKSRLPFTTLFLEDTVYALYPETSHSEKSSTSSNLWSIDKKTQYMQNLGTGEWMFVKKITLPSQKSPVYVDCLRRAKSEARILSRVGKYIGSFENKKLKKNQYIIGMELEHGISLDHFIRDHSKGCNLAQCSEISIHILNAVQKLHKKNIIHRDIKPANIMIRVIKEEFTLKIRVAMVDYEFSLDEEGRETLKKKAPIFIGTIDYTAPEIIIHVDFFRQAPRSNRSNFFCAYTEYSDVYATGVTLLKLFETNTCEAPIIKNHCRRIKNYIISRMCNPAFRNRPSIEDAIDQFKSFKEEYLAAYDVGATAENIEINEPELTRHGWSNFYTDYCKENEASKNFEDVYEKFCSLMNK